MASAWLDIANSDVRQAMEATVAKALLQVKVNLFIATEKSKSIREPDIPNMVFMANRRYAAAARTAAARPDNVDAILELEASLFEREQLERIDLPFAENQLLPPPDEMSGVLLGLDLSQEKSPLQNQFSPSAGLAATLIGDISQLVESETVFVDYSVISFQPPHHGRPGPLQGHRCLGIRVVHEEGYRIRDLGDATEIEAQCKSLIRACSAPGAPSEQSRHMPNAVRDLVPDDSGQGGRGVEFDRLAGEVYTRLVAPFEPLGRSLILSPDGILTAVPFHALVRNDRWLVEETKVTYCHSLHLREALFKRQHNPDTRVLPPAKRVALMLGDPKYEEDRLVPLPGTSLEISEVAGLLTVAQFPNGQKVFDEIRVHTGSDATASRLVGDTLPRVVHIAAHGGFEREQIDRLGERSIRFGEYYRARDEMGASPMTALDDGLLRCRLMLAKEPKAVGDLAGGAALTALELSSLELFGCHVVILSACETGVGVPLYGAGALGFQFAVQATCARAGLVSLWKVLDHETSILMTDFYKEFVRFQRPVAAYLTTVRRHCRRDGQRVHPYYWAAFVCIDNEYFNPMPW
jgi:CHAT domain-containing protein